MITIRSLAAASLLAGAALAAPAQAQSITAANPQSVVDHLRGEGLSATLKADKDGDPMIESTLGANAQFTIFFYNCTDHKKCATVQFYAGYTDTKVDANKLNDWNKNKRFGRAYIDKVGDPVVVMDLDLDGAGMSKALFQDNFLFWKSVMSEFSKYVYE